MISKKEAEDMRALQDDMYMVAFEAIREKNMERIRQLVGTFFMLKLPKIAMELDRFLEINKKLV